MPPVQRPGAWSRFAASFRASTGTEVFPLLAAFWEMDPDRYVEMASDAASRIAARPPLAGPRVLLTGAPVDGHTLHEAIESHGAVVVAEVGPWGSGAAGRDVRIDDDPVAALADKYRADSIGARTPVDSLRRWTESMLDEVDAVVVSLPPDDAVFGWDYPALRDVLKARRIPHVCLRGDPVSERQPLPITPRSTRWCPLPRNCRRRGMADKQLEATVAASAFQKQWFADLRRRVFDDRQPYALLQADVPFELFDLVDIPAVSNQWWAAIVAAKRQAPKFLDAMDADGLHGDLCRYCSLGYASTRYPRRR